MTVKELKWAFGELESMDRSMAAIHHFISHLKPFLEEDFYTHFRKYFQIWSNVENRLSDHFIKTFDLTRKRILTHSRSGAIQRVLRMLKSEEFTIVQTESNPGGEGVLQAEQFELLGIHVELIPDEKAIQVMKGIDFCLFGCDQYTSYAFVNKVGTKAIVENADSHNKPVIILGDTRKHVEELCLGAEIFEITTFNNQMTLITESKVQHFGLD